ncbi:MAG: hypothetical protein AAF798_12055 [Bacteroidota bacterium]
MSRLESIGHVERVYDIDQESIVSPECITTKKDGSVKITMDSRALNDNCIKSKHQMPSIDSILDKIALLLAKPRKASQARQASAASKSGISRKS